MATPIHRPTRRPAATTPAAPGAPNGPGRRRPRRARRVRLSTRLHARLLAATESGPDRGDVPGWVLVTVMSAGVVLAIWAVAELVLPQVFREAVTSVRRP